VLRRESESAEPWRFSVGRELCRSVDLQAGTGAARAIGTARCVAVAEMMHRSRGLKEERCQAG